MPNLTRSLEQLQQLKNDELIRMAELSLISGVRQTTLKYYSEQGILPFQQSGGGLTRRYVKGESIKRLKEIQKLKDKRFTMTEIKEHFTVK